MLLIMQYMLLNSNISNLTISYIEPNYFIYYIKLFLTQMLIIKHLLHSGHVYIVVKLH